MMDEARKMAGCLSYEATLTFILLCARLELVKVGTKDVSSAASVTVCVACCWPPLCCLTSASAQTPHGSSGSAASQTSASAASQTAPPVQVSQLSCSCACLCVCVCVSVCVCVCMYIYIYIQTYIHTDIHVCVCVSPCVCLAVGVCLYINIHTFVYTYIYTHIHVCVWPAGRVRVCVCIQKKYVCMCGCAGGVGEGFRV